MTRIIQIFSRDTFLLPLVICVVLPGMAGAWWRHSYGALRAEAATPVVAIGACDISREAISVSLHEQ